MHYGRSVTMAALGWALGCGPSIGVVDPDADGGTTDDTMTDGGPTTATSATITTTTTADPPTPDTGEDTSVDESTGADVPTVCTDAGPATPIAVLATDSEALVLLADATRIPLDLPPSEAPSEASVYTLFAPHGSWVAMTRTASSFDSGLQYDAEVALFTVTGERQWLRDEPNVSLSTPLLSADGVIVAARSNEASITDGVRYTDADALTLPGIQPRGEQRSDGLVPGWRYPSDGIEPVWIDTATLVLQPISLPPLGGWLELEAGEFMYFTMSGGDVALVREGPGGPEVSALPELGEAPESGYGITISSDHRWLLVADGTAQAYFRVDTDAGTAEPLDLTPPPDLVPLECYGIDPTIDDAGRIVMPLRDASAVYFGRLEPTTGEWDFLGDPVTAIDDASASAYGDTYILRTSAQGTTFCPPQEFEPAEGALVGATVQVLRPIDGTERLLDEETWPVPRSDGRCIAITDADGVTLVDLQDDVELLVPGMRDVYWWVD